MHAVETSTSPLGANIESVAFWSTRIPNWEWARGLVRGERSAAETSQPRPSPVLLAPTERRRAPDTVAVALEVAAQACRDASREPSELSSVFASTHGDLVINDYMCATLATAPALLSPTKFHHSVHNAAAGYWSIGTGTHTPYTAISAGEGTFATGLLEAVTQVCCDERPVLFVAYDIEARGPLAAVLRSRGLLAMALVLSSDTTRARASLSLEVSALEVSAETNLPAAGARTPLFESVQHSALSGAMPFFEALALEGRHRVDLRLNEHALLGIELRTGRAP